MGGVLRPATDFFPTARPAVRDRLRLGVLGTVAVVGGLTIARLPLLYAALGVALAVVAVGSLLEPLVGVGAALLAGLARAWLARALPAIPAELGQGLFLLAVGTWLARGLLRRELRIPPMPFTLPLLLFLGVTLLSLWTPADLWVGFTEWAKWVQLLLMAWLVYDRLTDPAARPTRALGFILGALMLTVLFQAGLGLWQFAFQKQGLTYFVINDRFYRAFGTFEQPNPYGGFMGMTAALGGGVLLVLAGEWVSAQWGRWRGRDVSRPAHGLAWLLGGAIMLALCGAALIASWSRGAWMGLGAALLVLAAALPRRGWWGLVGAAALVAGGVVLYQAGALPAAIASRLTGFLEYTRFEDVRGVAINDANFAVLERMAHWQAGLAMWRDHFWLGVGLGCYEPAYPRYALINWPLPLGHAHNFYLNLLAETGVVGLAAHLVLLCALLGRLWGATRRLSGPERGLALGLLGAWTHLMVHHGVDNLLVNNLHLYLGILLALSAWVSERARRPRRFIVVTSPEQYLPL